MDFDDRPADAAFRAEVRSWLEANADPRNGAGLPSPLWAHGSAEDLVMAKRLQAKLHDAKLAGITWPHDAGGRGGSNLEQVIFDEEAERFNLPMEVLSVGLLLAGPTIAAHGTPEQKERYLRPLLRGDEVWCQLFSEPDAGSDLAGVRTLAVPDGVGWVVNGQKVWSSGAHYADWGILLARTDPEAKRHRGLTMFVVDMRSPGLVVRPLKQMSGDCHFNEVFFDTVRLPSASVLGAVHDGWTVAMTTLTNERMLGSAFGIDLDPSSVLRLAHRRSGPDGQSAAADRSTRQRLAQVYTQAEILRYGRYRAITAIAHGRGAGAAGQLMKLSVARFLRDRADLAVQLCGMDATLESPPSTEGGAWVAQLLGSPAMRLAGGTDEIQRNILAERALGLPR